jgi:hypothetical protein
LIRWDSEAPSVALKTSYAKLKNGPMKPAAGFFRIVLTDGIALFAGN